MSHFEKKLDGNTIFEGRVFSVEVDRVSARTRSGSRPLSIR